MPIYEYVCQDCGAAFELLVRGKERPACPQCGGGRLDKQFSVVAAHTAGGRSLPVCSEGGGPGGCPMGPCGSGECPLE